MQERTVPDPLSPKTPRDIRGMNAAELMIGLAVVAILATISLPLVNNVIAGARLDGAARKIASDLRYTQALAVSRGGQFRLIAETSACAAVSGETRYRIEQDLPGLPVNWTPFTECYRLSSEYQGVTLTSITGTAGGSLQVQFNSRGVCVNCATPPVVVRVTGASGPRDIQVRTTGSVNIP